MSDQLLPPGSFKPPTRADFKDDSVPQGDAGPPTQTPAYAVNVDLPELATNLTVDMDKYITYTHSEWPSRYALLANRNNQSRGVIDLTLNRVVLFDDIDALHCAHNLLIHCLTEQEVNPLLWEEPYFETFYQESGWFIVPDSTRYRLLECHASKGWCVYDTQTQCIAYSGLHLTDKGILRICLEGRGDCFTWTPAKPCLLGHGNWGSVPQTDSTDTSDKRRDTYIDCLQQGASLGAVCDHVPSGEVKPSGEQSTDRYLIVQANNDRRSYAVWDQDKCRMAPVTTLTRVVEMWQRCVDGTDNLCWITVDQFKKSYGDWSVITQLGEVIDPSDVVPVMPTFKVGDWVKATREDLSSERAWKKGDIGRIVVADSPLSCVVEFVNQGKRKLHNGRFRICHGYLVHTNRPSDSPNGTDSCVGASPLHDGLKQGHRQLDTPLYGDKTPWSMATITSGPYAGKDVVISFEFADGWCVVDLGDSGQGDEGARIVHIDCMRLWVPVRSVVVRDGQTWFDPSQTKGTGCE